MPARPSAALLFGTLRDTSISIHAVNETEFNRPLEKPAPGTILSGLGLPRCFHFARLNTSSRIKPPDPPGFLNRNSSAVTDVMTRL
jgi:hypothetical protein